jgi:hypothetical protein
MSVTVICGLAFATVLTLVYPEVDAAFFTWVVFGNTAVFPIVFGIPLAILMQEEFGFAPCDRRL